MRMIPRTCRDLRSVVAIIDSYLIHPDVRYTRFDGIIGRREDHRQTSPYPIGLISHDPALSPSRHHPMTSMTNPAARANIVPSSLSNPGKTSLPSAVLPNCPAGVAPMVDE